MADLIYLNLIWQYPHDLIGGCDVILTYDKGAVLLHTIPFNTTYHQSSVSSHIWVIDSLYGICYIGCWMF